MTEEQQTATKTRWHLYTAVGLLVVVVLATNKDRHCSCLFETSRIKSIAATAPTEPHQDNPAVWGGEPLSVVTKLSLQLELGAQRCTFQSGLAGFHDSGGAI